VAHPSELVDFLASIMDCGGNVPMLGDADDSPLLRLSHNVHPFRSLLATGALLFERGDFKLKAGALDEQTRWLVPRAEERYLRLDVGKTFLPPRQQFPQGGVYVLGAEFGTPKEIRIGYPGVGVGAARRAATPTRSFALSRLSDRPGHLLVHAGALAPLLPQHRRAQHAARRRRGPIAAGRQLLLGAQGTRRLQPVAVGRREGRVRGLARRLHGDGRPGQAPPPDRARQARAPHRRRGHGRGR
jgi:hypothetical protein